MGQIKVRFDTSFFAKSFKTGYIGRAHGVTSGLPEDAVLVGSYVDMDEIVFQFDSPSTKGSIDKVIEYYSHIASFEGGAGDSVKEI